MWQAQKLSLLDASEQDYSCGCKEQVPRLDFGSEAPLPSKQMGKKSFIVLGHFDLTGKGIENIIPSYRGNGERWKDVIPEC